MSVDFSKLIPVGEAMAAAGLPAIGSLLSKVVPFPFSLAVEPLFNAVATALNVPPDAPDAPEQVQAAVQADPATAVAKLQTIEQSHKDMADAANRELELRLADVQDARGTTVKYVQSGSALAYGTVIISAIAVIGFLAIAAYLVISGDHEMRLGILTAMIGGWTSVLGYWLGSSAGSANKDAHLAELARSPTIQAQDGAHVNAATIKGR